MATPKKAKRDWLEPPDWWKKWKPLRWAGALLVLVVVASFVRSLLPDGPAGPEPEPIPDEVAAPDAPLEPSSPPAPGQEVGPSEAALAAQPPTPDAPKGYVPPKPAPVTAPPPAPVVATAPAKPATGAPVATPTPVATAPPPKPAIIEEEEEEEAPKNAMVAAYTAVETPRVVLMGLFRSYSGVDDITGQLKKLGFDEVPINSRHRPIRKTDIPPYDIDNIVIEGFKHLGQEGTLALAFFNDRLFEAEFRPANAEAYVNALRRAEPRLTRTRTGRTEFSDGPLYVNSSLDLAISEVGRTLGTRAFVLWQDQRILKQRDEWDGLFARKAAS